MKQYKCKNCGAPVEHSYNHRCPYCHAIFDFNIKENEIEEVKIEDMRNVELVEIERNHLFNTYRFLFTGYKCIKPTIYEVDNNAYVSSVIEYRNPPKCGFILEIPIDELKRFGIDCLIHRLLYSGLDYHEIDKLKYQIKEKWHYGT